MLAIQFPNKKALMEFAQWLCDQGEQDFFESTEEVGGFKYHEEDPTFNKNDRRRYGEFMANPLIVARPPSKD